LHIGFQLVWKSVTLTDLERHNSPYFALFHQIRQIRRPITSLVEDERIRHVQNTLFQLHFGQNWSMQQSYSLSAKPRFVSFITDSAKTARKHFWYYFVSAWLRVSYRTTSVTVSKLLHAGFLLDNKHI